MAIVGERFGGRKPAVPISPAVQSVGKPGSDGGGVCVRDASVAARLVGGPGSDGGSPCDVARQRARAEGEGRDGGDSQDRSIASSVSDSRKAIRSSISPDERFNGVSTRSCAGPPGRAPARVE